MFAEKCKCRGISIGWIASFLGVVSVFFLLTFSAQAAVPVISNGAGPTQYIASAVFVGNITAGTPANVYIYWGTVDGVTNKNNWQYEIDLGSLGVGSFSTNVATNIWYGPTYYYRCYASNATDDAWADSTTNFTTLTREREVGANFIGGWNIGDAVSMAVSESAGVVVAHTNWNNLDRGINGFANSINDRAGAGTSMTVTWHFNFAVHTGDAQGTGDENMMIGYMDNSDGTPDTVTISNITASFGVYDVYVYFGSDTDGRTSTIGIDGYDTYSFSSFSKDKTFPADYLQTTDTGTGYPDANYAVWTNLTSSILTITHTKAGGNSGIHGFQITAHIPEATIIVIR